MSSNELASTAKGTTRNCYKNLLALEHFLEVLATVRALEKC